MKKLFFLAATAMVAMSASAAYTLNNPVGTDGRYKVNYDCATGQFMENTMEADEAFVFAIDVKGTWLETWLQGTPATEGGSRGVAFNHWTSKGNTHDDFRRLKQISGTIWGCTAAWAQAKEPTADWSEALMKDSVLYAYAQIFGFEYTATEAGAKWWLWDENPIDLTKAPASPDDALFAFAPYTGTKTTDDFYSDDFEEGIYGFKIKGYAAPCVTLPTGIAEITATANAKKFVENGILYVIDANGVKRSVLGAIVK